MAYTKRTCEKCGIRKPQPEMVRKTKTQVSASTNFQRKNSTRVYGRPKTVWYCQDCANQASTEVFLAILGLMAFGAYFYFFW